MNAIQSRTFPSNAPPPPADPPATTPDEAYQIVDELLIELRPALQQDPTLVDTIRQGSREAKASFRDGLVNLASVPASAEECRQLAVQALAAGLLTGALDGALLLHADAASQLAAPAGSQTPDGIGEDIGKAFDKLMQGVQRHLADVIEQLKDASRETLQEVAAQVKVLGREEIQRADHFAGGPKLAYQTYLASCFALGYLIGGGDSLVVFAAGEVPGQPGQPLPPAPPPGPAPEPPEPPAPAPAQLASSQV